MHPCYMVKNRLGYDEERWDDDDGQGPLGYDEYEERSEEEGGEEEEDEILRLRQELALLKARRATGEATGAEALGTVAPVADAGPRNRPPPKKGWVVPAKARGGA